LTSVKTQARRVERSSAGGLTSRLLTSRTVGARRSGTRGNVGRTE